MVIALSRAIQINIYILPLGPNYNCVTIEAKGTVPGKQVEQNSCFVNSNHKDMTGN